MLLNHVILALLWIGYCVLHSLLAAVSIKKRLRKILGASGKHYRLLYTLLSFVFLTALLYYQVFIPTIELYRVTIFFLVIGSVSGLSGLALMLVCIKKYFMGLSGLRSLVQETDDHNSLLITGIHRYVRHPLYLGTFAFIWGLFLVRPYLSLLIANSVITVYTLIGIKLEEAKLIAEFGESYEQYRERVPKLLPFGSVKQKL
jgi:methanethiol S-methyltransferase